MTPIPAQVVVIGGGLAGSEATWQLARRGLRVKLYEMRPGRMTPAHRTPLLAELVCSNSFKSSALPSAPALLKEELALLASLVLDVARDASLPAGTALAVDREAFASGVTRRLEGHRNVEVVRQECSDVSTDVPTIIASGPLTSQALERAITGLVGAESLYFYDAAAPLIETASIDTGTAFAASRYGKGSDDYINCPMDEATYDCFHRSLVAAERVIARDFENTELFGGCQPVEEIALRGRDALRFGAMKPVGLIDPRTGSRPHAVVQLRRDNAAGTIHNMVGFQTNLKWSEQDRVFRMIPGLQRAEFARYGVMHRNTFVDSPRALQPTLALNSAPRVYLAGQIAGSEGYLEAAATGLVAALNIYAAAHGRAAVVLPASTAIGSLIDYVCNGAQGPFQPQRANLGLLPPLEPSIKQKRPRHEALARRALADLADYLRQRQDLFPGEANGAA